MKIIENDELLALVPHRGKMLLLSRVVNYDLGEVTPASRYLTAEYDIAPDGNFFDRELGGMATYAAFECMAQSIAALAGLRERAAGRPPRPGFILSVTNLSTTAPIISVGEILTLTVREQCRIDNLFTFNGEAAVRGEKIAQAQLTVMDARDFSELRQKNG